MEIKLHTKLFIISIVISALVIILGVAISNICMTIGSSFIFLVWNIWCIATYDW